MNQKSPQNNPFLWGAATAAFQIEGALKTDGRGPSIWDEFQSIPGNIYEGHTSEKACEHYTRYEDDIRLMKEIGLQAYRFSLSWSRILPSGKGPLNEKGLAFYDRLVDCLLKAGIQPWATLFHFDLPLELHRQGGWLKRDTALYFGEYASLVAQKLGDRVSGWFTINEPAVVVGNGYALGFQAPGENYGTDLLVPLAHHMLLGHGLAVKAIRDESPHANIGWAPNAVARIPNSDSTDDYEAARSDFFSGTTLNADQVSWFCDPVYLGSYPKDGLKEFEQHLPHSYQEDLPVINQPLDFLGFNMYSGYRVQKGKDGTPETLPLPPGHPIANVEWLRVLPETLYYGPKMLCERYGNLPFYVTENGFTMNDFPNLEGKVRDTTRIDFLSLYLNQLLRAKKEGIPIAGYFHWTLMDNFEWSEGYSKRFGLVYTDFVTQKRTLKKSAHWYRDVIKSNGESL